jgi:hypothetical protein
MQTQQIGTDICADVGFVFTGEVPVFGPTYQFKGTVTQFATGVFDVRIQRGEGVDLPHAEVVVHYNSTTWLEWKVERIADSPIGEIVYRVTFSLATFNPVGPVIDSVNFNPDSGSITIRRKVPSVN